MEKSRKACAPWPAILASSAPTGEDRLNGHTQPGLVGKIGIIIDVPAGIGRAPAAGQNGGIVKLSPGNHLTSFANRGAAVELRRLLATYKSPCCKVTNHIASTDIDTERQPAVIKGGCLSFQISEAFKRPCFELRGFEPC